MFLKVIESVQSLNQFKTNTIIIFYTLQSPATAFLRLISLHFKKLESNSFGGKTET